MRAFVISNSITNRSEKSLNRYLNDISKYDVLSPDEEVQLFEDYQSGDSKALDRIVQHNLRFVVSVAKKYQNLGLPLCSLINEGNIGLIKAAKRFDLTRGFKFISYAVWWIRQSILQALSNSGRNIRIPLNVSGMMSKLKDTMEKVYQEEEREPTLDELADACGKSVKAVKRGLQHYKRSLSLDAPVTADSTSSRSTLIADQSLVSPDHHVHVRESQRTDVQSLLSLLPEKEAQVISLYYGIARKESLSLTSISEKIGLGRERVRQIRDNGLSKLRHRARNFTPVFSAN